MAGLSTTLTKNFKAQAAIARRRIVMFGAGDTSALQATGSADAMIGVSSAIDAAIGEPCDVHLGGIPEVEFGGAVARGDPITSDAIGRAVAAAPAAGVNARIVGFALVSAVAGDIGPILLSQGRIQG